MFTGIVSKLKEAIGRNSTEGEAMKSDEECTKEKGLAQCSEDMDTQDPSDSPILFSQEDKQVKEEDNDSDCYEIVDRSSLEKEKRAKNMKDRSCLSLGRKRQVSEQSGQTVINNTSNKQRRVVDYALSKTEHPKIEHHKEICLPRVYKKSTCKTAEEADRNNYYYAPRHVKPALYTPVIVRKLESYRRRLRRVQSELRSHLHYKVIDPVSGRSRGRVGARVKRKSVVPYYKNWAERKKDNDPFVAALCEILSAMEPTHSAAQVVRVMDPFSDTEMKTEKEQQKNSKVCAKVSPRKSSKTDETSKDETITRTADVNTTNDDAMETVNNDVTTEAANCDVTMESVENDVDMKTINKNGTVGTVGKKVVIETVNNETSNPVQPVLDEKRRKAILEEASSDGDLPKFNFQRPVLPEESKVEEEDCVVVETVKTVAKEPSRQQTPECIECPMCYKEFSRDTIHNHAFLCNGVDEASTSSIRTVDVQDCQMSPVIKTRTPTKVKELKLLANLETKEKEGKKTVETNAKQNTKRISLEPRIRLTHVVTSARKSGETKRKQIDIKENEKNKPRQNINRTLGQRRLSNTRKNLDKCSWPDIASLKKDFLPLEFVEQENKKIPSKDVDKVLSMVEANSTESSSDEESITKTPVASKKKLAKSAEADDDMSALSAMATDYKGRKRKKDRNIKNDSKKVKVSSEEETVHCHMCGKNIPRLLFTDHVDEELARQMKEDEEKVSIDFSMMSSMSQNTDGTTDENTTSDSRLPLPDLAEGTTWSTNNEVELKTLTRSARDKQLSNDKGQSDRNKGKGRGQRGRGASRRTR